jgi:molybdopterin-guanine dinucleotide biosynthesis protein A
MSAPSEQLTGFILAGGASRRMGSPKHELMIEGETLLARTLRRARRVAHPVIVLGLPERVRALDAGATASGAALDLATEVLRDDLPGRGPLGAIYTGLRHTHTEFNLFLSCDLPFIEPRYLAYVTAIAQAAQADVTLARTPHEGYQPLAAIYRRRSLAAVRRSLERGQNKVTGFFPWVRIRVIESPELARAGFRQSIFDNLNTREDYARAVRKLDGCCRY